jgi:hypothetical protein
MILEEPLKSLTGRAGADPALTAAMVDKTMDDGGDGELRFYRRLLSGVLDPDKLDYLNRDARYCGVPYGAQDVDFIYSRLFPHRERGLEIDSRGIPSVESVLFSKYLMYRTVYWHRQVRSATAMIKQALLAGLERGRIRGEDLYGLDDQGLFSLMAGMDPSSCSPAARVRAGELYREAGAFPFDGDKHGPLLDVHRRFLHEEALGEEIRRAGVSIPPDQPVIIDIPEPVSFETDLYVRDEKQPFTGSSSAFRKGALDALVGSLRIVRIFTPIPVKIPPDILQNYEKWVQL